MLGASLKSFLRWNHRGRSQRPSYTSLPSPASGCTQLFECAGDGLGSVVFPLAQLGKGPVNFLWRDAAVTLTLHVLHHKEVARARHTRQQCIIAGYRGRNQWIVSSVDCKYGTH